MQNAVVKEVMRRPETVLQSWVYVEFWRSGLRQRKYTVSRLGKYYLRKYVVARDSYSGLVYKSLIIKEK